MSLPPLPRHPLSCFTALHSNVSRKDSKANTSERDVTIKNGEVLRARHNRHEGRCPYCRNFIVWSYKFEERCERIEFSLEKKYLINSAKSLSNQIKLCKIISSASR